MTFAQNSVLHLQSCINALIFIQQHSCTDSNNPQLKTACVKLTTLPYLQSGDVEQNLKIFLNSAFQILSNSLAFFNGRLQLIVMREVLQRNLDNFRM